MKRILVVLVLAALLAFGVPSLLAASQVTVTVMYNNNEFSTDMAAEFMKDNPDIKLTMLETDQARYMGMCTAGNPPDIMRCNSGWIPYLVAHKMVLGLDPYLKNAKYLDAKDFQPIVDAFRYKGRLYGFIKDWSPTGMGYFNKDLFAEAGITAPGPTQPITFAQLADYARKLQKMEGDRVVVRGLAHWPGSIASQLEVVLTGAGGNLYNSDGTKIVLTANPTVKAICKYFFDLAKDKIIESPLSPSEAWAGSMFPSGRIGMIFYGYWYGSNAEGETLKGKVGVLAAPTWDPAQKYYSPSHNLTGGFISSKTKHPNEAFRVFDWFFGGPPAEIRSKNGWGVPAQASLLALLPNEGSYAKDRALNLAYELKRIRISKPCPYILPDVYENAMNRNFELALRGQITFDQFLANAEKEINKNIADNRASMK